MEKYAIIVKNVELNEYWCRMFLSGLSTGISRPYYKIT